MGVDLDQKKGNLYRTYGADYYRRNLKSIVKGNSQLDIDCLNANEVMKNETNNFPEFANYIVNANYDYKQNNNIEGGNTINNELGGLNLNIDLGFNNINNENNMDMNFDMNNQNDIDINNNGNNINEIQINSTEKKIESIENKPEAPPSQNDNKANNDKKEDKKVEVEQKQDDDSAERRIKNAVKLSVIGLKKLGKFMKKTGIKGYDLAKKYGKASAKVATEYVKKNLNKNKETLNNNQ